MTKILEFIWPIKFHPSPCLCASASLRLLSSVALRAGGFPSQGARSQNGVSFSQSGVAFNA